MVRFIAISAAAVLLAAPAIAQPGGGSAAPPPASTGVPGNVESGENTGDTAASSTYQQLRRMEEETDRQRTAQAARSKYGRAVPAKASEVLVQATVYDPSGETVGTIDSVDADGAVVATAVGKVKIPLNAFGKNRQGLLVGVSKKDFEAQVTKAYAPPSG